MTIILTIISSTLTSYLIHSFSENFLTRDGKRDIKLIFKGRQIHHSFWAVVVAVIALMFTNGHYTLAMLGYSLGNIWQHKLAHNRAGEPGLVFISRLSNNRHSQKKR